MMFDGVPYTIPDSHFVDGVRYSTATRPENFQQIKSLPVFEDDIFLCGYPKSGNVWMMTTIKAILNQDDLDNFKNSKINGGATHLDWNFASATAQPRQRFFWSHLQHHKLPNDIQIAKIVYLLRNPKDTVTSYYHFHQAFRALGPWSGSFEEFLNGFLDGGMLYGTWYDHVRSFWTHRDDANIMFIKYEDLVSDTKRWVGKIADFLEKPLDSSKLNQISEIVEFRNMKENPNISPDNQPGILPGKAFMRKGIVGDWINLFSTEQSRQVDDMLRKLHQDTGCNMYMR